MGNTCLYCNSYDDLSVDTMNGKEKKARVVDIYDGDTCTIVFYEGAVPHKKKFRLYGIDTPELRVGKNVPDREDIKRKGVEARDVLRQKILGKVVTIQFCKEEKYGRCMGTIFYNKVDMNRWMVQNGYAIKYDGGKKN